MDDPAPHLLLHPPFHHIPYSRPLLSPSLTSFCFSDHIWGNLLKSKSYPPTHPHPKIMASKENHHHLETRMLTVTDSNPDDYSSFPSSSFFLFLLLLRKLTRHIKYLLLLEISTMPCMYFFFFFFEEGGGVAFILVGCMVLMCIYTHTADVLALLPKFVQTLIPSIPLVIAGMDDLDSIGPLTHDG